MNENRESKNDLAASIALLWNPPKEGTRGPKPTHSLERVLAAAITIADAEGLSAVSMQRLAQDLGFTKMAIYRYVPGRSELIALMTDYGLGPAPSLDKALGWRPRIEAWSLRLFAVFINHPWSLEATSGWRVMGPNEAAWTEQALSALAETGLSGADCLDILAVIAGHLRTMAAMASAYDQGRGSETAMGELMLRALANRPSGFPVLSRAITDSIANHSQNQGLTFGLNCIFDGIEWRLTKDRPGRNPRPTRPEDR